MKSSTDVKHVKDIDTDKNRLSASGPFKLKRENERRFVRLDISSPMSLKTIKNIDSGFKPDCDWHVINGMILNISAGGVLTELDQAVGQGDVVSMHFTLQKSEELNNVLGLVKRVDIEPDCSIVGIEFISREDLTDHLSQGEIDILGDDHSDFNASVREVLNRYITGDATARKDG